MEEQNNIVETKKKSPIGIIILVVILMIGCLIGGYFLNESGILKENKTDTKEKDTTKKEDKNEEALEVESDLVKKLDRNVTTAGAPYYGGFYELFTDKKMTANDFLKHPRNIVLWLRCRIVL